MRHEASDGTRTMPRHEPGRPRPTLRTKGSKATMDARGREYLALFARYQELDMQYGRQIMRDGDRIRELEAEIERLREGVASAIAAYEDVQEYVVLHAFDTSVGRRIDDYITERLQ